MRAQPLPSRRRESQLREPPPHLLPNREAERRFEAFIGQAGFPCVGAKSAVGRGQVTYFHGRSISSAWDDLALVQALQDFARGYRESPRQFTSFVAIFSGPRVLDERGFERALWARVQSLHDKDAWLASDRDAGICEDPDAPEFAVSIGGSAFFIVGLHPRASRKARRFELPTLVFNLHDQFKRLRDEGRYEKMRSSILDRDRRWSGSINPMLARHGTVSEARQYSGRKVEADWQCPFHPRRGTPAS